MNSTLSHGLTEQLERITRSRLFEKAARLRDLLVFLVEKKMNGEEYLLKETVLGIEVFRRGVDFDPKIDPIVRVDARRLRARLAQYYATEGAFDPLRIVLAPGSYVPYFEERPSNAERSRPRRSVAVLPFTSLSSHPEDEYFLRGLREEVLNTLVQLRQLHVISPEPTTRPDADHVLSGSIRRDGARLRITVSLLDSHDESIVWSQQYDTEAGSIFATQETVSRHIAFALGARPTAQIVDLPSDLQLAS